MSVATAPTSTRTVATVGWRWLAVPAALVIAQGLSAVWDLPDFADTWFSDPLDRFASWAQQNRRTHWLFTGFFQPLSDLVDWGLSSIGSALRWVPWWILPIAVFAYIARTRRWAAAAGAAVAMLYPAAFGLWDETIETLALMGMSVLLCVILGVPLGILGARHPRFNSLMRPVLDAMQTVPAPVYFVPMVLFFSVGQVPAVMATVAYALPPVVRLTTLGIEQVSATAIDASTMFGASDSQTLRKVQLPMALPTIMAGVTQTILMALGIVVLAALVGAGGLGEEVFATLQSRRTGRGIAVGLAVVAVAAVLKGIGEASVGVDRATAPPRRVVIGVVSSLAIASVVGRLAGWVGLPAWWQPRSFDWIDDIVDWMQDNLSWLTRWINDSIVRWYYVPVRDWLTDSAGWLVLVLATAALGWVLRGRRLAVLSGALVFSIAAIGQWEDSIDTLVQVVAAVALSIVIAIPIGILAGLRPRVETALGPILDALQTIPSLVYIIPVVSLFTIGVVPGIIASVLYAIVPGIRLTALGIRQVPTESVEASEMFGATPRQTMLRVRLPLAAKTIMAGINQIVMMVLAMVIISGLVGGGGLGFETISAVKRSEIGVGFEVGFAIVAMAIILDRMTQAIGERYAPP